MTDPQADIDQATRDRLARLQERRQSQSGRPPQPAREAQSGRPSQPAVDAPKGQRPGRRKRPHPAITGRIAAAGVGATAMLSITAALALDAGASSNDNSSDAIVPTPLTAVPRYVPAQATTALPDHLQPPPADTTMSTTTTEQSSAPDSNGGLGPLPEGAIVTGELSESGRPIVVILHQGSSTGDSAPGTASVPTSGVATASAPAPAAAPTQMTATRVVQEVAVPTAAAPVATTSGS